LKGELPETYAAETKLSQVPARSSAAMATIIFPDSELGFPFPLLYERFLSH
jgi:hypothetical protein